MWTPFAAPVPVLTKERVDRALLRLQEAKRRAGRFRETAPEAHHICHPQHCVPENEPTLIAQRFLEPPALTEDVYLCNDGYIHICTAEQCNNASFGVCNISGACHGQYGGYSSYDRQDDRTQHAVPTELYAPAAPRSLQEHLRGAPEQEAPHVDAVKRAKLNPTRARRASAPNLYAQCRARVEFLLYDKRRQDINQNTLALIEHKSETAIAAYLHTTSRNRIPPNVIMMSIIMDNYAPEHGVLLTMPEYNDRQVHQYCVLALHVYGLIARYAHVKEKVSVEDVALGVLYELRTGLKINALSVLAPDPKLILALPKPNDLGVLGINKKTLTQAVSLIKLAYNNAIDAGISRQELYPDMSRETYVSDEDLVLFALGGKNHKAARP